MNSSVVSIAQSDGSRSEQRGRRPKRWLCVAIIDPRRAEHERVRGVCFVFARGPLTGLREIGLDPSVLTDKIFIRYLNIYVQAKIPNDQVNRLLSRKAAAGVFDTVGQQKPEWITLSTTREWRRRSERGSATTTSPAATAGSDG